MSAACVFDTEFGKAVCVVLVGAMIVAGIETVATGKIKRSDRVQRQTHHMTLEKRRWAGAVLFGLNGDCGITKISGHGLGRRSL